MEKIEWMQKYKKLLLSKQRALTRVRNVNKKLKELQDVLVTNGW